jgi:2-oxoglutarate ferredoxin oxidoreductase subunit gamma
MRTNIRIAGKGGQGIVKAGVILGEAIAYEGLNVTQTSSYGSASRGEDCEVDVIVENEEITDLTVEQLDYYILFSPDVKINGEINDKTSVLVEKRAEKMALNSYNPTIIPAFECAEKLGSSRMSNLVMLGYFSSLSGIVSKKSLVKAIKNNFNKELSELNIQALEVGVELGREKVSAERPKAMVGNRS